MSESRTPTAVFATIEEAIEEIRQGKMVVVCDDEDRENEGDLVMAAQFVTPEAINFMAKEARGWICLALTPERCEELGLELMTAKNESALQTPFTITIEARDGVTTGVSAHDRAHTMQVAIDPNTRPRDLTQPGHVNPLKAKPGGVLEHPARLGLQWVHMAGRGARAYGSHRGERGPGAARGSEPGRGDLRGDERGRLDGARTGPPRLLRASRAEADHDR
jgi:3,4-dihydroxy-2-butanone 4-phosphate synthase